MKWKKAMSKMAIADKDTARTIADKDTARTIGSENKMRDPPLLKRKSVLTGIAASIGLVIANAGRASVAEAKGTVKPIAANVPAIVPTWTRNTAYTRGQQVVSPNNDVVSASVPHSSSTDYAADTAKWTLSSTFVTAFLPEKYGAKGDGVTDDTAAIQAAVDAVRTAGAGTLKLQNGKTYVVTTVDIQAGLVIDGHGATLLRPANTPNWTYTLNSSRRLPAASSVDAAPIVIRGLTIDGNLANQGPYAAFELQHSPLIFAMGNAAGSGRQPLFLTDVTVKNSVGDGVQIHTNVRAIITNLHATDCFRGGLTMTGGFSVVTADGYLGDGSITGASWHSEVDEAGFGGATSCDTAGKNISVLTPAIPSSPGLSIGAQGGSVVTFDGVVCRSGLYIAGDGGRVRIRNGMLDVWTAPGCNTILNPVDVLLEDCTIRWNNPGATAISNARALDVIPKTTADGATHQLTLRNCTFTIGASVSGDLVTAVLQYLDVLANGNVVTVDGGSVSDAYDTGFQLSGGTLNVTGRPYVAATFAIRVSCNIAAGRAFHLTVDQISVRPGKTYLWSEVADPANIIEHHDTLVDEKANKLADISGIDAHSTRGRRIIMVTSAPTNSTHGFKGDVARRKTPVTGSPYEWVCTTGGDWTTQVWKVLTTLPA